MTPLLVRLPAVSQRGHDKDIHRSFEGHKRVDRVTLSFIRAGSLLGHETE